MGYLSRDVRHANGNFKLEFCGEVRDRNNDVVFIFIEVIIEDGAEWDIMKRVNKR